MLRRSVCILVAGLAATIGAAAQTTSVPDAAPLAGRPIQISFVSADVVRARLGEYKGTDMMRENSLRKMFLDAGCPPKNLTEQAVPHQSQPNVFCTMPGTGMETIVVGAHFDHITEGDGIVDNWSGVSLLPSLLQSLAKRPREHSFVFVGFTGEEDGLIGSDFYVSRLKDEELDHLQAMINLDTLGLGPTLVWIQKSDPLLVLGLYKMAHSLALPVDIMDLENAGQSDEESFIREKICTLTVHSLTPATINILHHKEDNPTAIRFDDYYASYKLVAGFLTQLDVDPVPPGHVCKAKAYERVGMRGLADRWRRLIPGR